MAKHLTDFLDPRVLNITLYDIAQGIKKPVEKVHLPEKSEKDEDWKWANIFLIVIEGERGRFCSYRVLQCWLEAVLQLLTSCMDWQTLASLIQATEAELQRFDYPDAHKQRLQEVLVQQKARLEELKAKAVGLMKAWEWARVWERMIKMCPDDQSLNIAVQLFKLQKSQFAAYPEVIDWVRQVGRQHGAWMQ